VGMGSGCIYTVAVGPNIENFSQKNRGKVVGVMVSFFGLSSAIFTQLYKMSFSPNVVEFILFLSISIGSIGLIGSMFVNYPSPKTSSNQESEEEEKLIPQVDNLVNMNPFQAMRTTSFWLMAFSLGVSAGAGLMFINNVGNLMESLSGTVNSEQNAIDDCVTIISVFNFIGRAGMGFISDYFNGLPRPAWLTISVTMMGLSTLFLTISNTIVVYIGSAFIGLSYGGIWSMAPIIVHELWGDSYWGTNLALIGFSPATCSYLISTLLTGSIYQHFTVDGENNCFGKDCYMYTFFIITGLCSLGIVSSILLYFKTRKFYQRKEKGSVNVQKSLT